MRANEQARAWFGRARIVLVCGEGDFAKNLEDDSLNFVFARSFDEIRLHLETGALDAAIIEDDATVASDASVLAHDIRLVGIGIVIATKTRLAAERHLRERLAVHIGALDYRAQLVDMIFVASWETELFRRAMARFHLASLTPPDMPRMRYVKSEGQLSPSESTMAFVFGGIDDLPSTRSASAGDGKRSIEPVLVAPSISDVNRGPIARPSETVTRPPSESLLGSLRRPQIDLSTAVESSASTSSIARVHSKGTLLFLALVAIGMAAFALWRWLLP